MAWKNAAGAALAALLVAMPLQAQDVQWSTDRPDGHAPLGVHNDFTLPQGGVLVTYHYTRDERAGLRSGTVPLFVDDVLDIFGVAPLALTSEGHLLDIRVGLTDELTASASLPFTYRTATQATETRIFDTRSSGIGDLEVRLMYQVFNLDGYRAHLSLGAAAPTGSIDETDVTPLGPGEVQLPFQMQQGTGSWAVLPGFTVQAQNEFGTVGAQAEARIHTGFNDRGYRVGDRFRGTVWASYKLNDWVSASARVTYESWQDVEGQDPDTDALFDPAANPFATGGTRAEIPFGVNIHFRDGALAGHRASVEWFVPVHEDLHGPQLSSDRRLLVGFQLVF
ncbi:MAG: transporter [Gemmatimonadetes bacterium]|nr:MAG: transporter [Gemmatimonadota bacterium]